jgi:cation:H+ antiporter
MNDLLKHGLVYFFSFMAIWLGSGMVFSSVSKLARFWRLPAFTVSFFLLGILTSLPELAIGLTSLASNDPAIGVGNLLGGVIILFLLIIPLLGFLGNGIRMPSALNQKELLLILVVILAPSLLTTDQRLTIWEGILLLLLYFLVYFFLFGQSSSPKDAAKVQPVKIKTSLVITKIVGGVLLLFAGSHFVVNTTLYFANIFEVSPFIVSLLVVSLGTNIPEFSLIVRSLLNKHKDIALADYLGSAATNTLLMGLLSVAHGKSIALPNHFLYRFIILVTGLLLFFIFAKSKRTLSRSESLVLLSGYILFLCLEAWSLG